MTSERSEASSPATTLVLHGDVSYASIPHLEFLLDQVVGLDVRTLRIDLTQATGVAPDALEAIWRREGEVAEFSVVRGRDR